MAAGAESPHADVHRPNAGVRLSSSDRPGRDRRAVRHRAPGGLARIGADRRVIVVGGGIAGLAAAAALRERGVGVTLLEQTPRLGGRVAAWPVEADRTMSRGFHAFFRQYYNLRGLLRRADPALERLRPIGDYPLLRADGMRDSFRRIPRTPPWSVLEFVRQSPSFTLRSLARVDVAAALELVRVAYPGSYARYDGESAAAFLDRLQFPAAARDLALEVFARSFFADPRRFAAGELVAMFHTYFLGSAEGLLFDVPDDDYDTALWRPLGAHLAAEGVQVRTSVRVDAVRVDEDRAEVDLAGETLTADAVVVAADPRSARELIATMRPAADERWHAGVAATENAPPFAVVRLWLDGLVRDDRAAFLGTSGFGPVDNVSVLERFEDGAARWSREHRGSVVELHAYACDPGVATSAGAADALVEEMERQLHLIFPETGRMAVRHREVLIEDDCTLITPDTWEDRPGVATPSPRLVLAGDWVRCDYPVALMERAATTGLLAANRLLADWGVAGHDVWSVPMAGLLARRRGAALTPTG